jgi:DNA-binding CsgD family transcriptional regulator
MKQVRTPDMRETLTSRETDILKMLGKGASNKDICKAFDLSEFTVKAHVSSLLSKLGVASRTQAALFALKEGLVGLDKHMAELNDRARLAALQRSGLLDSPKEQGFDRFTKLVRRFLNVPVALFSLVDDQRQFFKSSEGLPPEVDATRETPLSHSFCQYVVIDVIGNKEVS